MKIKSSPKLILIVRMSEKNKIRWTICAASKKAFWNADYFEILFLTNYRAKWVLQKMNFLFLNCLLSVLFNYIANLITYLFKTFIYCE